MAAVETRDVLRYVPQFLGNTFIISIDTRDILESCLAEVVLDLSVIQQLGVNLIVVWEGDLDAYLEQFEESEIRFHQLSGDALSANQSAQVQEIFSRNQALLIKASDLSSACGLSQLCDQVCPEKLIFIFNKGGVYEQEGLLPTIRYAEAVKTAESDVNKYTVRVPSIGENLLKEGVYTVPRIHLLDGSVPGVLVEELFSNEGKGTMIYRDEYRLIRPMVEEDISEVLALISRSIRSSRLIPRDYETIQSCLNDYYVISMDRNVIGCVALHSYEGSDFAEVACLFVRAEQSGRSYGKALVNHVIEVAKKAGKTGVFALTKEAGGFFEDGLGFSPADGSIVPEERYQMFIDSERPSLIFYKSI